MNTGDQVYISYPSAVHYKTKQAAQAGKKSGAINHLLWGDWAKIEVVSSPWFKIRCRRQSGWVHRDNLQQQRLLEVNFVDIGQGDGCHIQTPDDRAMVIDAGEADNMYRFLRWRFGKFIRPFKFESFVVTHPDKDHYYGFRHFLQDKKVHIEKLFHNTIVEQVTAGKSSLGKTRKIGRKKHLTGLVIKQDTLKTIVNSKARRGRRLYPNMLKQALDSGRVGKITGLLASQDLQQAIYFPGFSPADNRGMTLKLLGPMPTTINNTNSLPTFGSNGKTKNGHSIILLLEIGHIRMLLGGDLNEPSQDYLLERYTGLDAHPHSPEDIALLINEARKHFEVDVAKACHHGSAHVAPNFLRATNPLITVISSGNNESHSHPRPDTLGMVGKLSRSDRPFIFSTELNRSSSEHIKHPNRVRAELKQAIKKETRIMHDPDISAAKRKQAEKRLDKHLEIIQRSVANYGMINVRTDGKKMIVAQRLEVERSKAVRWDIYPYYTDSHGRLHYQHD